MKLSIIIPVYNEKNTIEEVLNRVLAVDLSEFNLKREIIIIDDGSYDGTREILDKMAKNRDSDYNQIKVIYHQKNYGKGRVVRTGFKYMTGDVAIIQDADLELRPEDQPLLLLPIIEGKTKVVFGSRFRKKVKGVNFYTLVANKIFTFFTNFLYGVHITDVMTCYKVMNREVIKKLQLCSDKFDVEPELAAKICKSGYKIYEVPVSYNPRKFKSGKKIKFSDSFPVLWALFKYRFVD